MSQGDSQTSLQQLKDLVVQFREERDWKKHHTAKNLAVSIAIEAAELLEHFQWDEYGKQDKEAIADELADVLIYCMSFADIMDIDVATAFQKKLQKAAKKYPASVFNAEHDNAADYVRIKAAYREKRGKS